MEERTLSIVKPDAVAKQNIGAILSRFEAAGLRLIAARFTRLTPAAARRFYLVHHDKAFYESLVKFMSSGPIFVSVLEGDNAIAKAREVMGATDSASAAPGTIRRDFGTDVEQNAVHGSDGPDTARAEIGFFFSERDLLPD